MGKTVSQLTSGNPAQSGDLLYADRSLTNISVTAQSLAELPPQTVVALAYLLWPYPQISGAGAVALSGGSANLVWGNKVVLPWGNQLTVNKLVFKVFTAGGAGAKGAMAVYDKNGNKLLDTGAVDVTAANTLHAITLSSPVTLTPGLYYMVFTCSDTTCTVGGVVAQVNGLYTDATFPINVQAANASAAGVMPATLGALSAFGSSPPTCALLGQ